MKKNLYRVAFEAADGISFYAYHKGANELEAINELLNDVHRNGCAPFFPEARTVEKITSVALEC